jgi:hypothetical protein
LIHFTGARALLIKLAPVRLADAINALVGHSPSGQDRR